VKKWLLHFLREISEKIWKTAVSRRGAALNMEKIERSDVERV
jgi:hypothetical protein